MTAPARHDGQTPRQATAQPAQPSQSAGNRHRHGSPLRYILFSLALHLLFTISIFDIYFTSPVVHPSRRFTAGETYSAGEAPATVSEPPAQRLVLIVGDGLRADTLFKEHDGSMLPGWAQRDLLENGDAWASALHDEKPLNAPTTTSSTSFRPFFAAPHLRQVIHERGSWGLSHTRVPTESRPGHVALIAGMYEDISAVTKGWKHNPVNFDSIMNVSSHAYTFGSPDILPMFAAGAEPGKVDMWMYEDAAEDFTKDAALLDLWVLKRVEELFERARTDHALDRQMRQPGTVFFLHLLGLDTTGHTYRPQSSEYVGNLMVVDAITKKVEALFEEFYKEDGEDSQTAWIFSADHGMSSKGNHGDGEPDNTRTPLVAWGAGLRPPRRLDSSIEADRMESEQRASEAAEDPYYRGWTGLENLSRSDVQQADVTALMAAVLGLPYPANSEGRLPLEYLDIDAEAAARAMLANAQEVLEIYRVKHDGRKARMIRFVPYEPLACREADSISDCSPGDSQVLAIKAQISRGQFAGAVEASRQLIQKALEGAQYIQTYDWLVLVSIVTAGYLGSIAYSVVFLLRTYVLEGTHLDGMRKPSTEPSGLSLGSMLVMPVFACGFGKFAVERSPWTYYLYLFFAGFCWKRAIDGRSAVYATIQQSLTTSTWGSSKTSVRDLTLRSLGSVALALVALELMVLGYMHRWAWSAGFLVLAFPWPFFTFDHIQRAKNEGLMLLWGTACAMASLFTLEGVEKDESMALLALTGVLYASVGAVVVGKPTWFLSASRRAKERAQDRGLQKTKKVLRAQVILTLLTTLLTLSSSYRLQNKMGLPLANQMLAWLCLLTAILLPATFGFAKGQPPSHRLAIVVFAAAPIFILLSLRDEGLFLLVYTAMLLCWNRMEGVLLEEAVVKQRKAAQGAALASKTPDEASPKSLLNGTQPLEPLLLRLPRRLGLGEVRTSLFFLFFLHVGFFGTGNVASISSFYLSPVYRLVPVFNPFLMAVLLVVKILLPFVVLCSVLHLLCAGRPSARAMGEEEPPYYDDDEENGEVGESRPKRKQPSKVALEMAGPPVFGHNAIGGLGLAELPPTRGGTSATIADAAQLADVPSSSSPSPSPASAAYGLVVCACIFTDVLALNFLFAVETQGAWLEIGRSITHFAMSNLLQVFMYALTLFSGWVMYG